MSPSPRSSSASRTCSFSTSPPTICRAVGTLPASDIESIDALGDAINEFQGGVLVVSHDARLLTMTNCEMWLMDNQTVKPIEGGYEAYRDSLLKEMEFVGKRVGYIYLER